MGKQKTNIINGKFPDNAKPRCGLCGKTKNLIKTDCCGNWICDDEHNYVMFSYARNSCQRNHDRYTLCSYHHHEKHEGDWKTCKECLQSFETEIYVHYGTNEYNFEKLENPPNINQKNALNAAVSYHWLKTGIRYTRTGNLLVKIVVPFVNNKYKVEIQ
jgi:hypothetical protein